MKNAGLALLFLLLISASASASAQDRDRSETGDPRPSQRGTVDYTEDPVDKRLDHDPVIMFNPTVLLGGGLGIYYQERDYNYYPSLNVEISVSRLMSLGFLLNFRYSRATSFWALSANGLLTTNFYPLGKFNKLLVRLSGGVLGSHVSSVTKVTDFSPTAAVHLGWRFLLKDSYTPISLGLLVGWQFFFPSGQTTDAPQLQFEIGVLE